MMSRDSSAVPGVSGGSRRRTPGRIERSVLNVPQLEQVPRAVVSSVDQRGVQRKFRLGADGSAKESPVRQGIGHDAHSADARADGFFNPRDQAHRTSRKSHDEDSRPFDIGRRSTMAFEPLDRLKERRARRLPPQLSPDVADAGDGVERTIFRDRDHSAPHSQAACPRRDSLRTQRRPAGPRHTGQMRRQRLACCRETRKQRSTRGAATGAVLSIRNTVDIRQRPGRQREFKAPPLCAYRRPDQNLASAAKNRTAADSTVSGSGFVWTMRKSNISRSIICAYSHTAIPNRENGTALAKITRASGRPGAALQWRGSGIGVVRRTIKKMEGQTMRHVIRGVLVTRRARAGAAHCGRIGEPGRTVSGITVRLLGRRSSVCRLSDTRTLDTMGAMRPPATPIRAMRIPDMRMRTGLLRRLLCSLSELGYGYGYRRATTALWPLWPATVAGGAKPSRGLFPKQQAGALPARALA